MFAKEIIAFSALSLVLYLVALLCNRQKLRLLVLKGFSVLLYAILFVKLAFFILFKSMINASAFYIIFETHQTETFDFLSYYVDYRIILLFVVFVFSLIIGFKRFNKLSLSFVKTNLYVAVLCVLGILFSTGLTYKKFRNQDLALVSITAIKDYTDIKAQLSSPLSQSFNPEIKTSKTSQEPKTIVVVIGESTTKQHMGLYGYYRNTNPLLNSIKDELLVFNDVIASNVHTIEALNKALTLKDKINYKPKANTSIVQLANQAGFETYWVSNQKPVGINKLQ